MIVTRAVPSDLPRLVRFRSDTASWLSTKGIDQWSTPFPDSLIMQSITQGEVYVIREREAGDIIATVTLDQHADPLLWTTREMKDPAIYIHKLTVDRRHSGKGLGVQIIEWARIRAASQGLEWMRLDAWTTNRKLHSYYTSLGFLHVRTVHDPAVGGSGWVAQRSTQKPLG